MTNKSEIDELRAKVNALERQLPPTFPTEKEIAAAKDAAHQARERSASAFNPFSRADLAAFRAAAPDDVCRDLAGDARAPLGPRSIIPSSAMGSNVRGPVNTTGWQHQAPVRSPPGINYVDAQLDAQDRKDRHDLMRAEAIRRAAELKTKGR